MANAVTEKAVCGKCGFDVRDNTAFCYNCGSPVKEIVPEAAPIVEKEDAAPTLDEKAQAALDDLARQFRIDEEPDDKITKASAERKKARVAQRKVKEVVWEPADDSSFGFLIVVAVTIAIIAGLIVVVMVSWR